jgi:hypothetical protein
MVSLFCVRHVSKRWFLKVIQVTMIHDPFNPSDYGHMLSVLCVKWPFFQHQGYFGRKTVHYFPKMNTWLGLIVKESLFNTNHLRRLQNIFICCLKSYTCYLQHKQPLSNSPNFTYCHDRLWRIPSKENTTNTTHS